MASKVESKPSDRGSSALPKLVNTPAATAVVLAAPSPTATAAASAQPPAKVNSAINAPMATASLPSASGNQEASLQGPRRASSGCWAVPRVNPLQPEPPKRRTVSLETESPHHHNYRRTLDMQTRQYQGYHDQWSRPVYGSPVTQEGYRKQIRETLKFQMAERDKESRQSNRYKIQETNLALHNDNECHLTDKDDKRRKLEYLKQFRDENKRLMELREEQRKIQVVIEHGREREILRYNPINWTCSLK